MAQASAGLGIRVTMSRLRNTWAVGHLNRGVPICELMKALGVGTLDGMRDLIPYYRFLSDEEHLGRLSGRA